MPNTKMPLYAPQLSPAERLVERMFEQQLLLINPTGVNVYHKLAIKLAAQVLMLRKKLKKAEEYNKEYSASYHVGTHWLQTARN